mgnify:CR=1 FL=1
MAAQHDDVSFPARVSAFSYKNKAYYLRVPRNVARVLPAEGLYQVTLRLIGTLSPSRM